MSDPTPPSSPAVPNRWLSPQDWSLKVKLAVALLVPSLIAVVLGGLRVADQAGEAAQFDRIAHLTGAQGAASTLIKRLQDERLRVTEFIAAGRTGDQTALQASFADVDKEQAAIQPILTAVYADDPAVVDAHRQAEQALALLPQLRELVLRSDSPADTAVARYTEVLDQVQPLDGALLRGVNSSEVNGLATALAALSSARNEATLQHAMIVAATAVRAPGGTELGGLAASDARLVTSLNNYRTALDTGQRVRFAELIAGPANSDRGRLVQELTAADPARPLPTGTSVRAAKVYADFLAEADAAETGIRDELSSTTEAARTTAVNLAVLNVAVLLAALVIGAIIVGLISRAIISSLRTLRSSALEVAQKSLPDAVQRMRGGTVPDVNVTPVPVHTREEVGEVARAFDVVHAQAVRLAAEQATLQNTVNSMFVNLSRRSQSLVDRQLQLIEELESNEQDPDQLASLFRLDHLATRMRRNSENLLVLAGTDLAKRTTHHVPVVDVLQAAVSEVEQYERVTVEQPPSVTVLGRAANDLQHLLSELLDNATSFSPPETQVTMTTSRAGNGPLVVEIIDRGIGMRSDELDDINRRFADADDSRMTASRRMGLFVVGRLAARHGVQVRLIAGAPTPGPTMLESRAVVTAKGTGVTARVTIPAHLVASGPAGTGRRSDPPKPATALTRPFGGEPSILVPPQRSRSDQARSDLHRGDLQRGASGSSGERGAGRRPGTGVRPSVNGSGDVPGSVRGGPGPAPAEPTPDPVGSSAGDRPADSTPPAVTAASAHGGPDPEHRNGIEPTGGAGVTRPDAPLWPADAEPVPAESEESIAAPELFGPSPVFDPDDVPTTRTPIFEEVASGWFRAYRQVPINWQPDFEAAGSETVEPRPVRPTTTTTAPPPAARVTGSEPVPSWPPVRPAPTADDFSTAADEGWLAAVEAHRESPPMDVVPGSGLPRRTPGAQLLPGGIASAASAAAGGSRDADAIRSRLSNYQRGVRSGRSERDRSESEAGVSMGEAEAEESGAGTSASSGVIVGRIGPSEPTSGPDGPETPGSRPTGRTGRSGAGRTGVERPASARGGSARPGAAPAGDSDASDAGSPTAGSGKGGPATGGPTTGGSAPDSAPDSVGGADTPGADDGRPRAGRAEGGPVKPSPVKPSSVKPSSVKPSPVKPGPVKPGRVESGAPETDDSGTGGSAAGSPAAGPPAAGPPAAGPATGGPATGPAATRDAAGGRLASRSARTPGDRSVAADRVRSARLARSADAAPATTGNGGSPGASSDRPTPTAPGIARNGAGSSASDGTSAPDRSAGSRATSGSATAPADAVATSADPVGHKRDGASSPNGTSSGPLSASRGSGGRHELISEPSPVAPPESEPGDDAPAGPAEHGR